MRPRASHILCGSMARPDRRPWWKPAPWVCLWGGLYIAWLANLTLNGEGISAAFFTLPFGWLMLGSLLEWLKSELPAIAMAGAVNVAAVFLVLSGLGRVLKIRAFGETPSDE